MGDEECDVEMKSNASWIRSYEKREVESRSRRRGTLRMLALETDATHA